MKKLIFVALFFISVTIYADVEDYQYISPVPGSIRNNSESTIIIREGRYIDNLTILNVEVEGSVSGILDGELVLSSDKKTCLP